ncbi:MAG: squalene--hopene cyclase [Planctomycetota bacterium]
MTELASRPEGLLDGHDPVEVEALAGAVGPSIDRALDALYGKLQRSEPVRPGDTAAPCKAHWCAELEGDSILNTEYILMKWILGQEQQPEATKDELDRFERCANYIRLLQREEDGLWGQYPGSPPDISASVKAYFVLKLMGDDINAPHMARAREGILKLGGAEKINTFSMFYLACLGQAEWSACPSIPPEVVLLPRWSPFHLDKVAAWTRTMILPLAICTALRPVRELTSEQGIEELWVDPKRRSKLNQSWDTSHPFGWTNAFLTIDKALKRAQRMGVFISREKALKKAERWIVNRVRAETTHGLGAIFPPMVYIQVAFKALGYERDHAVMREAEAQLDRFFVDMPEGREDLCRIQPCFSPVWDTGTALYAVTEAGRRRESDETLAEICDWLMEREIGHVGDWVNNLRPGDREAFTRPGAPGRDWGCWAFEYSNEWYPDADDTAMVAMALWRAGGDQNREAARRGVRWMRALQNDDGGWAAFDRTRDRRWMEHVPFADHNAMQDPSCADITGRVLESLVTCGVSKDDPCVRDGVEYIRSDQRDFGGWFGRWGVNYIYGTWQAVGGLVHAGEDLDAPYLRKSSQWLHSIQNEDGGFGEDADSYFDESLIGRGPSTASQTAWAVMTLMYLDGPDDPAVRRAIAYLVRTQLTEDTPADPPRLTIGEPAGSWHEEWYTGTGFPKVFYLRYHLYRHYFPLMALARYRRLTEAAASAS